MKGIVDLYTTAAAREIDRRACAELGIDGYALMQRAGAEAWRVLRDRWPAASRLLIVCGAGNNGGDGYVVARLAREHGCEVHVVRLGAPRSASCMRAAGEWESSGGAVTPAGSDAARSLFGAAADLVVDALLGIGLRDAPDGAAAALIDAINATPAPVFSIDVPSGVDADSGHVPGAAVRATLTLSLVAPKRGLYTGRALDHLGERIEARLAIPDAAFPPTPSAWAWGSQAWSAPSPRATDSNKGDFGHVLCIGGDIGMGGSIGLSASAALRCGAGRVSVITRAAHVAALLALRPELMVHGVEDAADAAALLARADVIAIGPGLGQGGWGRALLAAALTAGKPLVVDADALNLVAAEPAPLADAVITPHPGEAARLLGVDAATIQADRHAAARQLAERFGASVVLKGAGSIVTDGAAPPTVIAAGNPGMATAGMGDVLTGVIAALRAQRYGAYEAARRGALLHALAGDAAAGEGGERGLLASDLFAPLRRLSNPAS